MPNAEPSYVRSLPPDVRAQVRKQCAGDWRRVTRDPDGAVTVHNAPQMEIRELPPQGTTATALKRSAKARRPPKGTA